MIFHLKNINAPKNHSIEPVPNLVSKVGPLISPNVFNESLKPLLHFISLISNSKKVSGFSASVPMNSNFFRGSVTVSVTLDSESVCHPASITAHECYGRKTETNSSPSVTDGKLRLTAHIGLRTEN